MEYKTIMRKSKLVLLTFVSFLIIFISYGSSSNDIPNFNKYYDANSLLVLTQTPNSNILIIDVRSESEYNKGHIPTAVNISSTEIINSLDEFPISKYYILYCYSGYRSGVVKEKLIDKDYKHVMDWGAISRWPFKLESNL